MKYTIEISTCFTSWKEKFNSIGIIHKKLFRMLLLTCCVMGLDSPLSMVLILTIKEFHTERRRSSVSSGTSEKRSNATIISISAAGESSTDPQHSTSSAPIVSPEGELSTAESLAALREASQQLVGDIITIKSATVSESSTDPEPEKMLVRSPTPPEAAPRTSLLSEGGIRSGNSTLNRHSANMSSQNISRDESDPPSPSKHWGPERSVVINRVPNQGLGISIVGGKIEAPEGSDGGALSGIFIKNVLEGSPAASTGQLNTGDRIIAVGDVDIRNALHEKAVEAIRQSGNPLKLVVQSLNLWSMQGFSSSIETGDNDETDNDDQDQDVGGNDFDQDVALNDLDRTVGVEESLVPPVLVVPDGFDNRHVLVLLCVPFRARNVVYFLNLTENCKIKNSLLPFKLNKNFCYLFSCYIILIQMNIGTTYFFEFGFFFQDKFH
jgi:hypothetical protein